MNIWSIIFGLAVFGFCMFILIALIVSIKETKDWWK